ncbi:uncharacterized protein LOC135078292 [Ostrinia nubilalis]|uniref:uncharacterized protein LOC135078292 n=1 Tax=Ostrinia nubilalis TaxID=29057 RepID=UPI0030826624
MKLVWCCVVAASVLAACAAVDVEKTVQQVQNILQANSGLPRLTRDEIIQLLNDIRAEDAKSKSSSTSTEDSREVKSTERPYRIEDNEINPITQLPNINENVVSNEKDKTDSVPVKPIFESTTKKNEPSVVVVLPYTPRDGSSLQELYTRPPRVEVVPVSQVTSTARPKLVDSLEKLHKTIQNTKPANKKAKVDDFPAELQAFLNAHGLKGKPGQDNFLLPLEGFKPLPPAKVVDGSVQLPENILLSYDLISSNTDNEPVHQPSSNNFLYEPLRPEFPFELDMSPSEKKETVLPLDLPVRKTKSTSETSQTNLDPIDYDAVRVIPLQQGLNPLDEVKAAALESDPNKRQADVSTEAASKASSETSNSGTQSNDSPTLDSQPADSGASIADLEDSFGGAAPEQPGDSELPPPRKNGFYWMLDWNSFLEVGDGDTKVNIRFEPKLGDPQMFIPVNVP